jgi:hypothetical protein
MSTKTTFKRVALVAVAALGLGVLSTGPSSAAAGVPTLTATTGSASVTAGAQNETTTAATVSVVGLLTASTDSYSVQVLRKSAPSTGGSVAFRVAYMETSTASTTRVAQSANGTDVALLGANRSTVTNYDSVTATSSGTYWLDSQGAGYVGAKFGLMVDSSTTRVAGTYVYTAIVTPYSNGTGGTPVTADLTFTITDTAANIAASGANAIDAGRTRAWLNAGSSYTTANDSAVSVVSTASATDHATLRVTTFDAAGLAAPESVTVTVTGAGVICQSSVCGKSIKVIGTNGSTDFTVRADGTAGTGSIVVATTTKTFPAKTVNFFAKAASTFAAPSVARPVIDTTATDDVVRVTATDAGGNAWTGAAYIYATSAASALIAGSETPVACTYDAADGRHECPVTGKGSGTASFKIIDASTVALATATSAEVSVRVSTATAGSVKLAFDKASYVPGERAIITAQVLDTAGLAMPATTLANLFATGAISSNMVLTAVSSNVLTSVSGTVAGANSSSDANNPANAGHVTYVVTMPQTTGTVTLTAKGGSSLAVAGQVAVSASADVVNPSVDAATDAANEATDAANAATDAALAAADAADAATAAAQDASDAVAALSASVSKLISSLRAQITSLTNLVIKIQKKVKA